MEPAKQLNWPFTAKVVLMSTFDSSTTAAGNANICFKQLSIGLQNTCCPALPGAVATATLLFVMLRQLTRPICCNFTAPGALHLHRRAGEQCPLRLQARPESPLRDSTHETLRKGKKLRYVHTVRHAVTGSFEMMFSLHITCHHLVWAVNACFRDSCLGTCMHLAAKQRIRRHRNQQYACPAHIKIMLLRRRQETA